MNIAVLYTDTQVVSWSMAQGIVRTIERMGHKVIAVPMPTTPQGPQVSREQVEMVARTKPPIEVLKKQDVILVSGPEHLGAWIELVWGMYEWKHLPGAKLAWLHESMNRDDYKIDFDSIKWIADDWFFPAIQDAEFHDQEMFAKGRSHYLPLGVDTNIFRPRYLADFSNIQHDKIDEYGINLPVFDVAFIGLMYPKRQLYLKALAQHQIPEIRYGRVLGATDLNGYDVEGAARLLASNYRRIKVFFNLPALSRMLVSKITEVMACGGFLVTPMLVDEARKNMNLFEDSVHLSYYRASNLPRVAQMLHEWASPEKDAERQKISEAGCRLVHEKHSLHVRMTEMLSKVRIVEPVQQ